MSNKNLNKIYKDMIVENAINDFYDRPIFCWACRKEKGKEINYDIEGYESFTPKPKDLGSQITIGYCDVPEHKEMAEEEIKRIRTKYESK
jgi:hypothetical protein